MQRAVPPLLVALSAALGLAEGPAQALTLAALGGILLGGRRRDLRPLWPLAALLVWVMAGVPGTLDDQSRNTSGGALLPLNALAVGVGALGFGTADARTLRRAATALLVALSLNALYGAMQVTIWNPPLGPWIAGRVRDQHLVLPDGRLRMATGLFHSRLRLAHVGALGLGLALLLAARPLVERRWREARGPALAAAAIALGLALTYRRGAPVALVVGSLTLGLALGKVRRAGAIALGGAVGLGLFALTPYGRERLEGSSADLEERLAAWRAAGRLWADHPWLGVGHGDYAAAFAPYGGAIPEILHSSPHSTVLQVLAETGLVGAAGFGLAVGGALVTLGRRVRRDRDLDAPLATLDRAALLGLATLLALGTLHHVIHHASVALLFWLAVGVALRPGGPGDAAGAPT